MPGMDELQPRILLAEDDDAMRSYIKRALENAAEAVKLLFTGAHDGKLLVRISPEP